VFEPANLGTKGQHATPRPPKPLGCVHYVITSLWYTVNKTLNLGYSCLFILFWDHSQSSIHFVLKCFVCKAPVNVFHRLCSQTPLLCNVFTASNYQRSETNVMHFLFSLLRINGLYMFWALITHPQEALSQTTLGILRACYVTNTGAANWHDTHTVYQVSFV
jgi:hypothetical protein